MRRLRNLIMAAAVAALAITAVGAPAAAAGSGRVMIVQGRPGPAVDVCINGREVKSKLAYGKRTFKKLGAGKKTLKVFKKDPRRCRGVLLSKKGFAFPGGSDLTIVITQKKPKKILVFDNAGLGTLPSGLPAGVVVRHAADIGSVTLRVDSDEIGDADPISPTLHEPVWVKGDQANNLGGDVEAALVWTTWVTRPDSTTPIMDPNFVYIDPFRSRRYEFMLVGTKIANLKVVTARRLITVP